jgi:DedD protein
MSRQQSRSSGDGAIDPSLVQKKRARHRLVGAICLCILAALIVPLVLESEPRPRDQELPIELAASARDADARPSSETVASRAATDAPGTPAGSGGPPNAPDPNASAKPGSTVASGQIGNLGAGRGAAGPSQPGAGGSPAESQSGVKSVTPPTAAAPAPAVPPPTGRGNAVNPGDAARAEAPRPGSPSQAARQEAARQELAKQEAAKQEAAKQEAAKQEAAKAAAAGKGPVAKPPSAPPAPEKPPAREPDVLARLIERTDDAGAAGKAAASRKFLVQIGAYSNVQSAKTASERASQVGLKPYQETVKTAQGDWIRVRVGPFTTRQDAERAQQDLKRAGVTAAIIAL